MAKNRILRYKLSRMIFLNLLTILYEQHTIVLVEDTPIPFCEQSKTKLGHAAFQASQKLDHIVLLALSNLQSALLGYSNHMAERFSDLSRLVEAC